MPRYFLNIRSDHDYVRDLEGGDYPNLDAVKKELEMSARSLLAASLEKGDVVDGNAFEVNDQEGALVLTYPFRDAMRLPEDER